MIFQAQLVQPEKVSIPPKTLRFAPGIYMHVSVFLYSIGIHSTTSEPTTKKKTSPPIKSVQAGYLRQPPISQTDRIKHHVTQYVRLALVEKEDVTIADGNLNEITELTLQGEVDKILKKKESLGDLKDIFNKPCPRLILIIGAPGEYYKVLVVVVT